MKKQQALGRCGFVKGNTNTAEQHVRGRATDEGRVDTAVTKQDNNDDDDDDDDDNDDDDDSVRKVDWCCFSMPSHDDDDCDDDDDNHDDHDDNHYDNHYDHDNHGGDDNHDGDDDDDDDNNNDGGGGGGGDNDDDNDNDNDNDSVQKVDWCYLSMPSSSSFCVLRDANKVRKSAQRRAQPRLTHWILDVIQWTTQWTQLHYPVGRMDESVS